jgi:DNA-binding transcriptional MerR regulator
MKNELPEINDETNSDSAISYTIDELSAKTGVPSRTIRFYQAKGALQPPMKKGRVAYYGEAHVERLQLVATLQDRGLNLNAICDLVKQLIPNGQLSVNEWLGLEERLQASWADDEPKMLSEDELRELLGSSFRPGLIAELESIERIRREGIKRPATYFVPSVGMLRIALKLEASGVNLQTIKTVSDLMRKRLSKMADELIELFVGHFFPEGDVAQVDTEKVDRAIQTLRDIWFDATRLLLAQEIERAVKESFERGDFLKKKRRKF